MTRPAAAAAATAAQLLKLGHEPILAPCLTVTPRAARFPVAPAALIITSSQAVPMLPARFNALPTFCVGDATAARLRAAGFTDVSSAAGDADDLFRLILSQRVPGPHLLAVGAGQGAALAARLRVAGIVVSRRAVYAAEPVKALPPAVQAALAEAAIDAALFYSAETARAFTRLAPPGTKAVAAYALSRRVATALGGLPWRAIHVALAPNEADLMALLHE